MMKFDQITEDEETGWSDWITPNMDLYKMSCCDCGLVHNMEFLAIEVKKYNEDGTFDWENLDTKDYRVAFRAQRNNRSTGQMRRNKKEIELWHY